MAKFFINLHETTLEIGWSASIATSTKLSFSKSDVAVGESEIYNTKEQAWSTIQHRVSQLNYTNDEVFFNHITPVNSYNEVTVLVAAL